MLDLYFGLMAGILTSIRLLPQVHKSLKTRKTRDLSAAFLIILFFQGLLLILYGATKPDFLIAYMNIVPFICSIILIYLKVKFY